MSYQYFFPLMRVIVDNTHLSLNFGKHLFFKNFHILSSDSDSE